jgi:acyl dehydratase
MTGRLLSPGLYSYETLCPGDHYATGTTEVTAPMIAAFAALTGDRFEIHLSDADGRNHGFAGQVAHGLLVLSLIEGLKFNAPVQLNGVAAVGWDWCFTSPVLSGDSLHARITVLAKRYAGPKSGLLTLGIQVCNQHGTCVQSGQSRIIVQRQPT